MGASGEEEVEIGFKLGDEGAEEKVHTVYAVEDMYIPPGKAYKIKGKMRKAKNSNKKSSHTRKACVRQ